MKRLKAYIPMITLVSPTGIWLLLFVAVPMIYIFAMSFMVRGPYGDIEWTFTLQNYQTLCSPLYAKSFLLSFLMSAAVTLLCLLIGYPFAYFIAQKSLKMRIILLMLLMLPFMTNSLLRIYGWIIIIRTEGLLNQFLLQLQLLSDAQSFLYTNGAVLLGLTYTLLPFMVLPLYSSIEKLDISLREASNDLGAKAYKTFLHITLPLTMPGIFAGAIMVFIPSFGLFFIVDLLGGNKAMLIGNLIRNQFLTARNWPFGAALSMLLVLLTLVLVYLYKRTGGKMNALGGR